MKKVLLVCAFALALVANTFAQSAPAPATPAQGDVKMDKAARQAKHAQSKEKAKAYLGLTEQQEAQAKEIRKAAKEQAQAIKADASLDKTAKKAKMQQLRADEKAKMKAIMTPEQIQKMETLKEKRGKGGKRGKRGGEQPADN
jgi:periplasmic protein CpxP/Spy